MSDNSSFNPPTGPLDSSKKSEDKLKSSTGPAEGQSNNNTGLAQPWKAFVNVPATTHAFVPSADGSIRMFAEVDAKDNGG